jgi:ferredoxin
MGWIGSILAPSLAQVHPTVDLAHQVWMEDAGRVEGTTDETDAFRGKGKPGAELFEEARKVKGNFLLGGWILGAFLGLVFGLKFVGLFMHRDRSDYEPDRGECLGCARCFRNCPREQAGRKGGKE